MYICIGAHTYVHFVSGCGGGRLRRRRRYSSWHCRTCASSIRCKGVTANARMIAVLHNYIEDLFNIPAKASMGHGYNSSRHLQADVPSLKAFDSPPCLFSGSADTAIQVAQSVSCSRSRCSFTYTLSFTARFTVSPSRLKTALPVQEAILGAVTRRKLSVHVRGATETEPEAQAPTDAEQPAGASPANGFSDGARLTGAADRARSQPPATPATESGAGAAAGEQPAQRSTLAGEAAAELAPPKSPSGLSAAAPEFVPSAPSDGVAGPTSGCAAVDSAGEGGSAEGDPLVITNIWAFKSRQELWPSPGPTPVEGR